jgi:xylulokinase
VIAVDSSTTASKAVIWDRRGQAVAEGRAGFPLLNPQPGWKPRAARQVRWIPRPGAARRHQQVDPQPSARSASPSARVVRAGGHSAGQFATRLWLDERSLAQVAAMDARFGNQRIHQITGKPVAMTPRCIRSSGCKSTSPSCCAAPIKSSTCHVPGLAMTSLWKTSWACADRWAWSI